MRSCISAFENLYWRPSDNSVNAKSNFGESPQGEVRRIHLPRTPMHQAGDRAEAARPRPSTSAITDRPLANWWVGTPTWTAVPLLALGEVHGAHHLAILNQDTEHVSVALLAVAACASHCDPALPFMEARRKV
jgi:hypothetical protein